MYEPARAKMSDSIYSSVYTQNSFVKRGFFYGKRTTKAIERQTMIILIKASYIVSCQNKMSNPVLCTFLMHDILYILYVCMCICMWKIVNHVNMII